MSSHGKSSRVGILKAKERARRLDKLNPFLTQLITYIVGEEPGTDRCKTLLLKCHEILFKYDCLPQVEVKHIERIRKKLFDDMRRCDLKKEAAYLSFYTNKVLNSGCSTPYLNIEGRVNILYAIFRNSARPIEVLKSKTYIPLAIHAEETIPCTPESDSLVNDILNNMLLKTQIDLTAPLPFWIPGPKPSALISSTPRPSAPGSSTPRISAPRPSAPGSSTLRSSAPRSSTPRPSAPGSSTPRPSAPGSSTARPSAPGLSTPRPSTPRSSTRRPNIPRPSTLRPIVPGASIPILNIPGATDIHISKVSGPIKLKSGGSISTFEKMSHPKNENKVVKALSKVYAPIDRALCNRPDPESLNEFISDVTKAERRLRNSIHHSCWNNTFIETSNRDTLINPLNIADFVQEYVHYKSCGLVSRDVRLTTEYRIMREVALSFIVPFDGVYITFMPDGVAKLKKNISIPSILTQTLQDTLQPILNAATHYHQMCTYTELDESVCKTTYEYFISLKEILSPIIQSITEFQENMDDKAVPVEKRKTILFMLFELQPAIKIINFLHNFHKKLAENFDPQNYAAEASGICAGLYQAMKLVHTKETSCILSAMYLQVIRPYIEIIESWLSFGWFHDPMNEFIVAAKTGDPTLRDLTKKLTYMIRPVSQHVRDDPVIKLIITKVLYIGLSVQMLIALNRLCDYSEQREEFSETLYDELIRNVLNEILRASAIKCPIILPAPPKPVNIICDDVINDPFSFRIELNRESNNLKLKDFSPLQLLSFGELFVDTRDRTKHELVSLSSILYLNSHGILDVEHSILDILDRLVVKRYSIAGSIVKKIMIGEHGLIKHYNFIQDVYLFRMVTFDQWTVKVFSPMLKWRPWCKSILLTRTLQMVMLEKYPKFYDDLIVIVKRDWRQYYNPIDGFNALEIEYVRSWPVNSALDNELLNEYKYVFLCMLRVRFCMWILRSINIRASESKTMNSEHMQLQLRRLQILYFGCINLLTRIQSFFNDHVFCSWVRYVDQALHKCDNCVSLYEIHLEYVKYICGNIEEMYEHGCGIRKFLKLVWVLYKTWDEGATVRDHCILKLLSDFKEYARIITEKMDCMMQDITHRELGHVKSESYIHL